MTMDEKYKTQVTVLVVAPVRLLRIDPWGLTTVCAAYRLCMHQMQKSNVYGTAEGWFTIRLFSLIASVVKKIQRD